MYKHQPKLLFELKKMHKKSEWLQIRPKMLLGPPLPSPAHHFCGPSGLPWKLDRETRLSEGDGVKI